MSLDVAWPVLAAAALLLAAGLSLYLWAVRSPRARYVNSTNVIAWLLVAMVPALIIFSFFPDSDASGEAIGFGVTGAAAGFTLFFLLGLRAGKEGITRDQDFAALQAEIDRLTAALANQAQAADGEERPSERQEHGRFRVKGRRAREIAVITGDLREVDVADVWVSSENTNMEMARYYEGSVSSTIRYLGARRDEAGDPVDDLVMGELGDRMRGMGKTVVQPATVIATGPGELARTNGVRRIYHVAAVQGRLGVGYRPVENVGECVANAFARFDSDEEQEHGCSSILVPMLGTGVAHGPRARTAEELVTAAVRHLARETTRLERVYFIARSRRDADLLARACEECESLSRARGSRPRFTAVG